MLRGRKGTFYLTYRKCAITEGLTYRWVRNEKKKQKKRTEKNNKGWCFHTGREKNNTKRRDYEQARVKSKSSFSTHVTDIISVYISIITDTDISV